MASKTTPYLSSSTTSPNQRKPNWEAYNRLGPKNKERFRVGSMNEKKRILKEYQINPRNTSSSSYAVSGIEQDMLPYYNMLPDKLKKMVLSKPAEKRNNYVKTMMNVENFGKNKK
jgi:hypothetical protein